MSSCPREHRHSTANHLKPHADALYVESDKLKTALDAFRSAYMPLTSAGEDCVSTDDLQKFCDEVDRIREVVTDFDDAVKEVQVHIRQ